MSSTVDVSSIGQTAQCHTGAYSCIRHILLPLCQTISRWPKAKAADLEGASSLPTQVLLAIEKGRGGGRCQRRSRGCAAPKLRQPSVESVLSVRSRWRWRGGPWTRSRLHQSPSLGWRSDRRCSWVSFFSTEGAGGGRRPCTQIPRVCRAKAQTAAQSVESVLSDRHTQVAVGAGAHGTAAECTPCRPSQRRSRRRSPLCPGEAALEGCATVSYGACVGGAAIAACQLTTRTTRELRSLPS